MENLILDCDPGHDDAVAILLAAGNPQLNLLGITTVAGNQTLEKVTRNALAVCAKAGIRVPVAAGAERPLVREQLIAGEIHGASGLDGPVLPEPAFDLDPRPAAQFIVDTVMTQPAGTVHLVPIGPLTNIALAMRLEPRLVSRVKSVVLMGGAVGVYGRTPVTEFNIQADPEAAAAVFEAGWPITMVPLDLTYQALATDEVLARIGAEGGELGTFVVEMLTFFGNQYRKERGLPAAPVHDPCAVAKLIDPAVFTSRPAFVAVELTGTWTWGQTVTDYRGQLGRPHNAEVADRLDTVRFWDLVTDAIVHLHNS
ncbi:MAG: nucleoside hydrolase [Actinobacteria bacterium]|nr:nucleoside hydrolase [Actinomycetota bacterium]